MSRSATPTLSDQIGYSGDNPIRSMPVTDHTKQKQSSNRASAAVVAGKTGENSTVEFAPGHRSKGMGQLDRALLERAIELLDGIEHASAEQRSLTIESLRCVTCQLWSSAATASQYHQSLLTLAEGVLISCDNLSDGKTGALRGAFQDLRSRSLNESYIDVHRSRFVDEGYNPLGFLSSIEADNGGNTDH